MRPSAEDLPHFEYRSGPRYRAPLLPAQLACLILLLSAAPPLMADDAAELARIRAQIVSVRDALESDSSHLGQAREKSFELARKLLTAEQLQASIEPRILNKTRRIEDLHNERARLETEVAQSRVELNENIVARYVFTMQSRMKMLLNQDQVHAMSRNLAYYDYVMQSYNHNVVMLNEQLQAMQDIESALKLETNALRTLRFKNDAELKTLGVMRDEQQRLIAAIEKRMADGSNRAEQLHNDERRLLDLLGKFLPAPQHTVARVPFAKLKGKLAWPAVGPVTKAPGAALREGGARWAGVLIAGQPGGQVKAIADGDVVFADWFRNLGMLVIVDHGGGFMTLYGNNAEVNKKPGESVAAGDNIATIGGGTGEMPAGVYFELREGGQPLDPRPWCAVH
jgi:septal ring factor EnvC (AmiA/AmiB activator)